MTKLKEQMWRLLEQKHKRCVAPKKSHGFEDNWNFKK